jgi:CheY-like chemotaxis protein
MSEQIGAFIDGKVILLVDDSAKIRPLIREILSSLNCRVLEAQNAEDALEVAGASGESIDLLLTDVAMPGMNGLQLAAELRRSLPHMNVLCMSGHLLPSAPADGVHFIEKPFRADELIGKVQALLSNHR